MFRSLRTRLSILALGSLTACMSAPPDLDLSLNRPTVNAKYLVALQPPSAAPAINQMHSWHIKLSTPDGAPVSGALIAVDGGMPQHGHGLPTQPKVTRELAAGLYLMEGMKFSMTGWWEIKLAIQGAPGADRVTFNTVIKNPSDKR
ncbi:FixH family protein [Pelomonas sp. SE-A7]|uniref:FixH family protein n=1 Tax=Pelomonas sp. SE-A7 TaxID=3054953 RepID=UPI00259C8ADE|nr:FixH family protein [Pelomonas sp. SE-A7]MDM4765220.1 FixH family protein [Pelomonas sp. SE-A7]